MVADKQTLTDIPFRFALICKTIKTLSTTKTYTCTLAIVFLSLKLLAIANCKCVLYKLTWSHETKSFTIKYFVVKIFSLDTSRDENISPLTISHKNIQWCKLRYVHTYK